MTPHVSQLDDRLNIVALCGSFRRNSYNAALLQMAGEVAVGDIRPQIYQRLDHLPWFNEDLEAQGDPTEVAALRRVLSAADGLLIATPEYNAGIPGVLKNAIDWMSRPPARLLKGMPVAIIGASPGRSASLNAQRELRRNLLSMGASVLCEPEFGLTVAADTFDASGRLADTDARRRLRDHVTRFARAVREQREGASLLRSNELSAC